MLVTKESEANKQNITVINTVKHSLASKVVFRCFTWVCDSFLPPFAYIYTFIIVSYADLDYSGFYLQQCDQQIQ